MDGPRKDAANIQVVPSFTVCGGIEGAPDSVRRERSKSQYYYADPYWDDPDEYIARFVQPEIDRGARRMLIVKACGMLPVDKEDKDRYKLVAKYADREGRSRAMGPRELLSLVGQHKYNQLIGPWYAIGEQLDEIILHIGLPPLLAHPASVMDWVVQLAGIQNVSFSLDTDVGGVPAAASQIIRAAGFKVYREPSNTRDYHVPGWPYSMMDTRYETCLKDPRFVHPRELAADSEVLVMVQGADGEDAEGRWERTQKYAQEAAPGTTFAVGRVADQAPTWGDTA